MSGDDPALAGADWKDKALYARLRGIDRTGLMWEWLRRDPDYIAWYTSASQATKGVLADADALRWGLHFRGAARHRGPGGADHLARRS